MGDVKQTDAIFVVALGLLSLAACGPSPAFPTDEADSVPVAQIVGQCTTYAACLRALERANAERLRCNGCPSGAAAVREVRARVDALYLEENREAIEQEKLDRQPKARPAPDPAALEAARVAAAAQAAELARQRVVLNARSECVHTGELGRCDVEAASPDERSACRSDCEALGKQAAIEGVRQRLRACVHDEGAPTCAEVPWAEAAAISACSKRCGELRRLWARYLAMHALCCDGSRSPSCTNGSFGRGCCSHHGGGCLEAEPPSEWNVTIDAIDLERGRARVLTSSIAVNAQVVALNPGGLQILGSSGQSASRSARAMIPSTVPAWGRCGRC